jgi:hypothetical protein
MYQPPSNDRPGCRETLILTRAAFAVLLPIFGAMIAIMSLVIGTLYLLLTHPVFAIVPLVMLFAGIVLFARLEKGRIPPPDQG